LEKFSKAISYILHPLLIPSLGLLVMFNSGTYLSYLPFDIKKWMFIFTFVSTYLIPLSAIFFIHYQGIIKSMHLRSREERYAPLGICMIMFVFCFYLVQRIEIPKMYDAFLFASVISVLITLLITMKFKISIHMVGTGGLTALIGFLAFYLKVNLQFYLIVAVILAGLTGSARLILKAHTPLQVYTGFIAGFTAVFLTMLIYSI
jgi:hypothetical protein